MSPIGEPQLKPEVVVSQEQLEIRQDVINDLENGNIFDACEKIAKLGVSESFLRSELFLEARATCFLKCLSSYNLPACIKITEVFPFDGFKDSAVITETRKYIIKRIKEDDPFFHEIYKYFPEYFKKIIAEDRDVRLAVLSYLSFLAKTDSFTSSGIENILAGLDCEEYYEDVDNYLLMIKGSSRQAGNFVSLLPLPNDFFEREIIREIAHDLIFQELSHSNPDIITLAARFHVHSDDLDVILKESFHLACENRDDGQMVRYCDPIKILDELTDAQKVEFIKTEEFQVSMKQYFLLRFRQGFIEEAFKMVDDGYVSEDYLHSEKFASNARDLFVIYLRQINGAGQRSSDSQSTVIAKICIIFDKLSFSSEDYVEDINAALKNLLVSGNISDKALFIKTFFKDRDFSLIVREVFVEFIELGDFHKAKEFRDLGYDISGADIDVIVNNKYLGLLNQGKYSQALQLETTIRVDEDFIKSKEARDSASACFISEMRSGNVLTCKGIAERYGLDDEFLHSEAVVGVVRASFPKIINNRNKQAVDCLLEKGIINAQILSVELVACMKSKIGRGNIDEALEVINTFPLVSSEDIYQGFRKWHGQFFDEVEINFPELIDVFRKSPANLIVAMEYRFEPVKFIKTFLDNEFLLEVLENNDRHGGRLLMKFGKLDRIAQNNIRFLYKAKAKILADHPDIDVNSVAFRMLMQDELREIGVNKEIIIRLAETGVDMEAWLNYDKEVLFDLGQEEVVAWSEKLKNPFLRTRDALKKYNKVINKILADYKKNLQGVMLPNESIDEIKKEIEKAKENLKIAQDNNDAKKIKGINKGIESLEKKLGSLKPIDAWEKTRNLLAQLNRQIMKTETSFMEMRDEEHKCAKLLGKELFIAKGELKKKQESLKIEFVQLEKLMEDFEWKLTSVITPVLSKDRADSLMEEINERMAEDFDHFSGDKRAIKSIFVDDSENGLSGRPMKIAVTSRNPDVDLYLGNYTNCCVRIDSDFHGEESPIADYVTDLGMQNVAVYDEKTGDPVVVCWCYIGKEGGNDKPVFVIDNIEANTDYSINFRDQLTKKLREYISDYAKKCNIKYVSQGEMNNDLELYMSQDPMSKFGKLYNRPDGYYLESEVKGLFDNDTDEQED